MQTHPAIADVLLCGRQPLAGQRGAALDAGADLAFNALNRLVNLTIVSNENKIK
jgi:hypothetical protein